MQVLQLLMSTSGSCSCVDASLHFTVRFVRNDF